MRSMTIEIEPNIPFHFIQFPDIWFLPFTMIHISPSIVFPYLPIVPMHIFVRDSIFVL